MGMFDRVILRCPGCGYEHEAQTKAGPCHLIDYELHTAPPEVAADVVNEEWVCRCGARLGVHVQVFAQVVRRS